jgi:hypothetical protein
MAKEAALKPARFRRVRIARLKKWTPIIVTWLDAATYHEAAHSEDDFECWIRKSIGYFIKRTPEAITIAMEDDREHGKDNENDCQTVTSIPISMVGAVTVLTPITVNDKKEKNDRSAA